MVETSTQKQSDIDAILAAEAITFYRNILKAHDSDIEAIRYFAKLAEYYIFCIQEGLTERIPSIFGLMFEIIILTGAEESSHDGLLKASQMLINQMLQKYQLPECTLDCIDYFLEEALGATAGDIREDKKLKNQVILTGLSGISVLNRRTYALPKADNIADDVQKVLEERGLKFPKSKKKKR